MTASERVTMLNKALDQLSEHFDHVQILTTWQSEDGSGQTESLFRGAGNWYARQGMAQSFIEGDIAEEHANRIAEELRDDDDSDGFVI